MMTVGFEGREEASQVTVSRLSPAVFNMWGSSRQCPLPSVKRIYTRIHAHTRDVNLSLSISDPIPLLPFRYRRFSIQSPFMGADSLFSRLWSRDELANRILAGENIFIYRSRVIRVPHSWLARHPGGHLAILHFVGRDATDEIDAFHSDNVLNQITGYTIGRVQLDQHGWEPFMPPYMNGWFYDNGSKKWSHAAVPINSTLPGRTAQASGFPHQDINDPSQVLLISTDTRQPVPDAPTLKTLTPPPSTLSRKIQAQHSAAYKELHERVREAGLYQTRYLAGYGPEFARYILSVCLAIWFYRLGWFIPSAVCLGFFWHQLTFTAHDAGHMGITHNWTFDRMFSIFIADLCGGLSIGWWVDVSLNLFVL